MSSILGLNNPASNSSTSNATSSNGASSNSTSSATAAVQQQYNTFLKILTTELQNQDPTSPLDTNQFTSQLVQFSQLEQSLSTNSLLQQIANNQTQGQISGALGYLGHTVQVMGDSFPLDGSDPATLQYSLASSAKSAVLNVVDSSGQTVRQISVDPSAGQHIETFDGNDASGQKLPAGTYTFQIQAVDATGTAVDATTYETGRVTGVDSSNGTVNLHLGSLTVPASTVVQIIS
jgi:flagellar basal-body rod modification protein FlgD